MQAVSSERTSANCVTFFMPRSGTHHTRCVLRSQLMDAGRNTSANATAVGVRNGSDTTTKSRVRTAR